MKFAKVCKIVCFSWIRFHFNDWWHFEDNCWLSFLIVAGGRCTGRNRFVIPLLDPRNNSITSLSITQTLRGILLISWCNRSFARVLLDSQAGFIFFSTDFEGKNLIVSTLSDKFQMSNLCYFYGVKNWHLCCHQSVRNKRRQLFINSCFHILDDPWNCFGNYCLWIKKFGEVVFGKRVYSNILPAYSHLRTIFAWKSHCPHDDWCSNQQGFHFYPSYLQTQILIGQDYIFHIEVELNHLPCLLMYLLPLLFLCFIILFLYLI